MADFTLTRPDIFPNGTTVHVYPRPALGVPSSGAPSTTETTSGAVSSDSVTFTGLADGTSYIAYAGSPDRYVSFRTPRASSSENTLVDAKGDLLVGSGSDALGRLPVGSNTQVLTADSAQTLGVKWAAAAGGGGAATLRLPILGWALRPDDSGDCYPEPFDILASNDVWKRMILRFGANNAAQPTLKAGVYGGFAVPHNYSSAANLIIVWSASLTSGDVVWSFEYRTVGGNDTTSLDQAGTEAAQTVTDTAPGAAFRRLEASIDLTDANFTADEEVEFYLSRDGTAGGDTMAGSAILFGAYFEYLTT